MKDVRFFIFQSYFRFHFLHKLFTYIDNDLNIAAVYFSGVRQFETRWIGWAGVNVTDEADQIALTKALEEQVCWFYFSSTQWKIFIFILKLTYTSSIEVHVLWRLSGLEFRQAIILFKSMVWFSISFKTHFYCHIVPCYGIQQQFGLVGNLKLKPF